jgi:hypothetical protein
VDGVIDVLLPHGRIQPFGSKERNLKSQTRPRLTATVMRERSALHAVRHS